jgi:phage baseplate assembly protein W
MAKKFLGLQYPLVKTPRGLFAQKNGIDQIKADLLQLLLTNPGERVMLPAYGTPLRTLFFDPNDASLAFRAREMIARSIEMWEPRIVIENVSVTPSPPRSNLNPYDNGEEQDAILFISIKFVDPQNISVIEELAMSMPIGV